MTTSYNGWPASTNAAAIGIDKGARARGSTIAFPPGVKGGDVEVVLMYVAGELHRRVEPAGEGCWGYNYRKNRNANNLSCHASGTAFDWNAPKHPNGKGGTFSPAKVKVIRAILAEVGGVVKWGGDFGGTKDEMHFEIHGDAAAVKKVADHLRRPVAKPAAKVAQPKASWFTKPLKVGAKGADVKAAQLHLHAAADGDFGPATLAAVKHVQAAHGLPVTGVIDARTSKVIGG